MSIKIGIDPGVFPIASVVVLLATIYFMNRLLFRDILTGQNHSAGGYG